MPAVNRGYGGIVLLGGALFSLAGCGSRTPAGEAGPGEADGADRTNPDAAPGAGADSAIPTFPVGVYHCTSDLAEYHSAAGGSGTLTVTQAGAVVTTTYAGDYVAAGALQFMVTTGTSANPVASGQTFGVIACAFTSTSVLGQESVTSGSLTMDGVTLFLTIVGTLTNDNASADCPAEQTATLSLLCTKS
jgi:hypothetical protein